MPEMLKYAGKRFTVSRRVEKICDTITDTFGRSRRMQDTVYLDDLRCDGSGHGGCQAGCLLYWKQSWLRRVDLPDAAREQSDADGAEQLQQLATHAARAERELDGARVETYRCQATEAVRATQPLGKYDLRQYVRELASGNVGFFHFLRVAARGLSVDVRRRLGRLGYVPLPHQAPLPAKGEKLDLQPGDLVQVRTPDEIAQHARPARKDARTLVRLGDDPVLRRHVPSPGSGTAHHRRQDRPHDRDRKRLPHPQGRRLRRRAQHRPLVLSESDLSVLARGVASARRSRKLSVSRVEELTQLRGVNVP